MPAKASGVAVGDATSIAWAEMIQALGRFGLSDRESELYLTLLQRGHGTAREVTKERAMDRVLCYRLLDGLRQRGILSVTSERPRRYVPVPPSLLFERALEDRRLALDSDRALAGELATRLPKWVVEEGAAPRYQLISGGSMLYPTLGEMVGRATEQVSTMITRRALRDSMRFGLHRRIAGFVARGGRFRLLVEEDPMLGTLLERFARSIAPHPSAEIRTVSPQPTRMTVVDGRELLLYLVPETRDEAEEVAIWTNTPAFARGHQIYFEEVWKRAQPIRDSRSPGRPARGPRAGTEDLSPVPPRRRRPAASSATDPAV